MEVVHRRHNRGGHVFSFLLGAVVAVLLGFTYIHYNGGISRSEANRVVEKSAAAVDNAAEDVGASLADVVDRTKR
ncbi:MAG: hypothetical protein ABWZ40_03885 [Caulobacterales bacterium]